MKENAQILLRMLSEFHRQVQDSFGEQGKPALLLGNPVVRTFNAYLNQMKEMFPDSFIAQIATVEPVPEPGESELASDELEKLHLAKSREVSMACSQVIEYLTGMLNGEAGVSQATFRLPEIIAVLDALRQEIQELKLTDRQENVRVSEILAGKYNDCLSVCYETVGEGDAILPRLFKPIEFADDEVSCPAIQEVKISASGLHAYLEGVQQQEAALKKQQSASILEPPGLLRSRLEDWMATRDRNIRSVLEEVRGQAEETKDLVFQKIGERIEHVEVQFEGRVQHLEERLDEVNERTDGVRGELDERMGELDERYDERTQEVKGHLEESFGEVSDRIAEVRNELDERMGELDERYDERTQGIKGHLEESVGEISERIAEVRNELDGEINERDGNLEEKLGERIGGLEGKHDDELEHLQEELREDIGRLEEKIGELEERAEGKLEERLEEIKGRLDEINERLEGQMDDKVNHLEEQLDERIGELDGRFDELKGRLDELEDKLDEKVNEVSEEREESVSGLENRIEELREEIEGKIEELRERLDE